jgi:hypothetical protein
MADLRSGAANFMPHLPSGQACEADNQNIREGQCWPRFCEVRQQAKVRKGLSDWDDGLLLLMINPLWFDFWSN